MSHRKKPTLSDILINLVVNSFTIIGSVGKIFSLLGFEARIAGRGLVRIIILAIVSGVILTSIWLCLLSMLFIYLSSLNASPYVILLIIIILNSLLMAIIALVINNTKKQLLFPEIRKELKGGIKNLLEK